MTGMGSLRGERMLVKRLSQITAARIKRGCLEQTGTTIQIGRGVFH
jgi:hypothetical protein